MANERRLQFEESLLRAAWWCAVWSIAGPPKGGYADIRAIVRGIAPEPMTPQALGEKFRGLVGDAAPTVPLAEVGPTLPFARKEVTRG